MAFDDTIPEPPEGGGGDDGHEHLDEIAEAMFTAAKFTCAANGACPRCAARKLFVLLAAHVMNVEARVILAELQHPELQVNDELRKTMHDAMLKDLGGLLKDAQKLCVENIKKGVL